MDKKPQSKTYFFCTYKNAETKGAIKKSREYESMQALLTAMTQYLSQHPWTTVWYQSRTVWF